MSYRDDAYFNLQNIGEPNTFSSNNANFFEPNQLVNRGERPYPDNKIRFLAEQSALDGTNVDYTLKRGYIRGLPQPGISDTTSFTSLKCQFQFNPQTIQQVVVMDSSTLLPLLQDPYQFTQPMGKSTNFQFDLVFDRSRNVVAGPADNNTDLINNGVRYKDDVGQLGALADLYLLYAIIGQGFSKELIEYQVKRLAQASIMQVNSSGSASANSPTSTEITNDNVAELANRAVNLNIGNSAFIIPTPVRVIFSSLFMVDGFVTGTTVDFLKFSTSMVPLQIRVGLSMEAMYLGFARQKTFLTESLELAGQEIKRQEQIVEETRKDLVTTLKTYMSKIAFGWSGDFYWSRAVNNSDPSVGVLLYQLSFAGKRPGSDWDLRQFNIGFYDANLYSGSYTTPGGRDTGNGVTVKELLADSGEPTTISYEWWFEVYGPYQTSAEASQLVSNRRGEPEKHTGTYSGSSTSADSWFFAKTYPESVLLNNSKGRRHTGLTDNDYNTARNNRYYAWKLEVKVTASRTTSSGPVTLTDTVARWGSGLGSVAPHGTITVDWGQPSASPTNPRPGDPV